MAALLVRLRPASAAASAALAPRAAAVLTPVSRPLYEAPRLTSPPARVPPPAGGCLPPPRVPPPPPASSSVRRLLSTSSSASSSASSSGGSAPEPSGGGDLIGWPKNLKIDRKSTSSPFFGAERVVGGREVRRKARTRKASVAAAAVTEEVEEGAGVGVGAEDKSAAAADAEARVEEEYEGEEERQDEHYDDDDDVDYYDLSTRPEPQYVIPIPDRLHVPVILLWTGEEVGTIWLSEHVFGLDPIRPDLIHRVVTYQRNKKRGRRKAKTKTIAEKSGSGRKVRRQKGMGMARAGHSRPPHWRGGAKAHGPKGSVQDYTTKLNKKVRKLGLRHALSQKLKEGNLMLVSDMRAENHRTKFLAKALDRYDIGGRYGTNAYLVDDATNNDDDGAGGGGGGSGSGEGGEDGEGSTVVGGIDINFKVASGNIEKVQVVNQIGTNVYDILRHEKLVLSLAAVQALEARL